MLRSPARDPRFDERIKRQVDAIARNTPYHSLELADGAVIPGIIPVEQLRARLDLYPLPRQLAGKRVLDIGAASGWNSFELEKRGAEVVAVDCILYEEFEQVKRLLGSRVEYLILDMDEITPERLGRFDYVVFFGVLYHLRHPLLALEKVCALTREFACVESFVTESDTGACQMEFYETDELGGQIDNWFGPTPACLAALCRSAGFARVRQLYLQDRRAGLVCYRNWEQPESAAGVAPLLCSAVNNRHNDMFFSPEKDEYICVYFRSAETLARERVFLEIDDLGVPPLVLARREADEWQLNVRVPPGLEPGSHRIRLRTAGSPYSNVLTITVLPAGRAGERTGAGFVPNERVEIPPPRLILLENTLDRTTVFHGYRAEHLACRFSSQERELDGRSVLLEIDDKPAPILAVSVSKEGSWQVNARLPATLLPGTHTARVRTHRSGYSERLTFTYRPDPQ